jgi:hypothetical protein
MQRFGTTCPWWRFDPHPAAAGITAQLAERFEVTGRVVTASGGLADCNIDLVGGPVDQVVITRVLGNVPNTRGSTSWLTMRLMPAASCRPDGRTQPCPPSQRSFGRQWRC